VAIVTVINAALGMIVGIGAWLLGLPSPLILGIFAMLLNYLPYVGPACMAIGRRQAAGMIGNFFLGARLCCRLIFPESLPRDGRPADVEHVRHGSRYGR
jgi:hypothetical protein